MDAPLLEMRGIAKRFNGVPALRGVDLRVARGEIHALVGENGAGKSTLMKVLCGVYPHPSYEGEIRVEGRACRFAGIADSERLGIVIIHQELALVPTLSITENLFLGHEPARHGWVDAVAAHARARALLARVGLDADPDTQVGRLGVGQQQLVEIAKALGKQVRLLVLDEPTASLNERDSQALLALLLQLQTEGVASILISHKLGEVRRVAQRMTVLRDGASVAGFETLPDEDAIIQAMVGRPLDGRYPQRRTMPGDPLFELRDWCVEHPQRRGHLAIRQASLTVRRGEIVGLAGLMGAGRTELAMSVFGRSWGRWRGGQALVGGQPVDLSSVPRAIAAGIAYVTEDRKGLGLVLGDSVARSTSLAHLRGVARRGLVDEPREHAVAQDFRRRLAIRCRDLAQPVGQLSGGNQQKVVLANWLFTGPRLLILDEPTRGIDVGAKQEIYTLIASLAEQGCGVLLISSEMPELLGLCERLYVMNEGAIVAEMPAAQASQEAILRAIVGAPLH
ncbi:sugar ABC transporter ATP-binding protein [Ideonella sp. 4Y16]|uniref:sugar ABC transporter ATP-binding protein n=1 Tax=Ideonella alba TaxID=2824118 RepID=UPI001B35B090|nr:sugar ABC transporter ATP-binding protein [Ideonella alba]MBQ0942834.1 sugar ABC transporter ATP-binding protein [Ideonella alba]